MSVRVVFIVSKFAYLDLPRKVRVSHHQGQLPILAFDRSICARLIEEPATFLIPHNRSDWRGYR